MPGTRTSLMPGEPVERIVLTGFMGSGKTTVGRLLAKLLAWQFVDLDEEITRRVGLAVPEIFARHGESYFRQAETLALTHCLRRERVVLAMGGGAPEAEGNRALLTASGSTVTVFLDGEFDTLQARCMAQSVEPGAVGRPILANEELARERFSRRVPLYVELAVCTLDTSDRSPEELASTLAAVFFPGGGTDSPALGTP